MIFAVIVKHRNTAVFGGMTAIDPVLKPKNFENNQCYSFHVQKTKVAHDHVFFLALLDTLRIGGFSEVFRQVHLSWTPAMPSGGLAVRFEAPVQRWYVVTSFGWTNWTTYQPRKLFTIGKTTSGPVSSVSRCALEKSTCLTHCTSHAVRRWWTSSTCEPPHHRCLVPLSGI